MSFIFDRPKAVELPHLGHFGGFTQAGVDAMSAALGYIRIPEGMDVTENVTVRDPIHFMPGAFISIADGVRVWIEAAIHSPRQYIFRRTGTTGRVSMRSNADEGEESRAVHLSWFGAFPLGDQTIDQAVFINRASEALGTSREGTLIFDIGIYHVRSTCTFQRAQTVLGQGDRITNIYAVGALATTGDVFETGDVGVIFRGFQFNSAEFRTADSYINLKHDRCEAYDCYFDKYYIGISLNQNEGKVYRTKGLGSGGLAGSAVIKVQGNRCTVIETDMTNFDGDFPESIVRVNANGETLRTLLIRGITGDAVVKALLIEVGGANSVTSLVAEEIAVERASDQIKVELTGTATLEAYNFAGIAAIDGARAINMQLDGSGDAKGGAVTGVTGKNLTGEVFRAQSTSTGVLDGLALAGVAGEATGNGIYIAGPGSPHRNIAVGTCAMTGAPTDGLEINAVGAYIGGFVTDGATGVRLGVDCDDVTVLGQYTGAGSALVDNSAGGTNTVGMTPAAHA